MPGASSDTRYYIHMRHILRGVLSGAAVFVIVSACLLTMYLLSWQARQDAIRRDLIHSATEVAAVVDPVLHEQLSRPEQTNSDLYRRALAPLVRYHRAHPNLYYVYTMVLRDGKFCFVLDTANDPTAPRLDENVKPSTVMELYDEFTPAETQALLQNIYGRNLAYAEIIPSSDSFGTFVSGFAPIPDAAGRIVAFAGVDIALNFFNQEFANVYSAGRLTLILALALSLLVGVSVWHHSLHSARQETALRENERQFRELVELMPAMILETDPAGRIHYANRLAQETLGRPTAPLVDREMSTLFDTPEDRRRLVEDMQALAHGQPPAGREATLRLPGGGELQVGLRLTTLRQAVQARGYYLLLWDMTEQRRLERQLRQDEKLKAIGQLAGGVAHDFNNQLTVIQGFAALIAKSTQVPPLIQEHCRLILDASRHSAALARQLLAFARKSPLKTSTLNVNQLVKETAALLHPGLNRVIALDTDLRASPATIRGDASQLENALLNLAFNARDAQPKGGRLSFVTENVRLSAAEAAALATDLPAGEYVQIAVADQGPGLTPEAQLHLFEPFFTTKPIGQGTGMGLASVYGSVKHHGGHIYCQSRPQAGATFYILLPAAAESAAAESAPPAAALAGNLKIMAIDDEAAVTELVSETLTGLGLTVEGWTDPLAAIERYRAAAKEFDVILLDMIMPGLNGQETFEQLRQINPSARIILVTGYSASRDAERLQQAGACGLVLKPFTGEQLAEAIARALKTPAKS